MMSNPIIYWFRLDLRLRNNTALIAAYKTGKEIIPVYIYDVENEMPEGPTSKWWLNNSLYELSKSLDNKLLFFKGVPKTILSNLVEKTRADSIFWNRCYDPYSINRDSSIKEYFTDKNIEVKSFNSSLIIEPFNIKKKDGGQFKDFTPFY